MNRKRTAGMTLIAILNFILGAVGLLACFFGLVVADSFMSNPTLAVATKGAQASRLLTAVSLVSLPSAGALIVSGIGLLRLAPWARRWTIAYAFLSILGTLIGFFLNAEIQKHSPYAQPSNALLTIVAGCVYPALLLYLIHTRRWRETLSGNDKEPS